MCRNIASPLPKKYWRIPCTPPAPSSCSIPLIFLLCVLFLSACSDLQPEVLAIERGQAKGFSPRIYSFRLPERELMDSVLFPPARVSLPAQKKSGFSFFQGLKASETFRDLEQKQIFAEAEGATPLHLFGLIKKGSGKILHVYIEGDGKAYLKRDQASLSPTPAKPLALFLALNDPWPLVLYLARPGQFLSHATYPCPTKYWTHARMSREVQAALNYAIDSAKEECAAESTVLVGYSGGGGLAALLAAWRDDVVYLATLAGNLNLRCWEKQHDLSPLTSSEDPMDIAEKIASIKQRHLLGTEDRVIAENCSEAFCRAAKTKLTLLPGIGHNTLVHSIWNYTYSP